MGAMAEDYAGSMAAMSETYAGKQSTLQDAEDQLNAAMGEGYNTEREKGIDAQIEYLSGEAGAQMEEMYSLIGQYQASLENAKEEAIRDAMTAVVEEDPEYQQALRKATGRRWASCWRLQRPKRKPNIPRPRNISSTFLPSRG